MQEHLHLLPSQYRANADQVRLRAPQSAALATMLRDTGRTVVVDLGGHTGDAVDPVLQQSDAVLVCLRPERAAIVGARNMLGYLQSVIADSAKIQLLMVDYGVGDSIPRSAVESFLQQPLHEILYMNLQDITRTVNRHKPLIYSEGQGKLAHQFRRLSRDLVPAA
jgi:Flp pilus assembly CpaE family ATPase